MKKLIYLLLISLLSFNSWAQDTIRISQSEIDDIIAVIDTLVEADSINNIIIEEQSILINEYETLAKQDSLLLMYKHREVQLLNDQIDLHIKKFEVTDKWYNKRPFGFILGVTSTILLIHTIEYTLP